MFNFAILQRPMPHQATTIKRNLFWQLGGYDVEFGIAADQLLMLRAAAVSPPMPLADFLCDFDSTGISANRSLWAYHRDSKRMLRHLEAPVTRSRTLDNMLAFGYSLIRHLARSFRAVAQRPDVTASPPQLPAGAAVGRAL